VFLLFAFQFLVLPKGLLDDFGNDKPGDDADASAKHVVVMLGGDLLPELLVHGLVTGRPGTKDFTEAFDEGVPLLATIHEGTGLDSFQEAH